MSAPDSLVPALQAWRQSLLAWVVRWGPAAPLALRELADDALDLLHHYGLGHSPYVVESYERGLTHHRQLLLDTRGRITPSEDRWVDVERWWAQFADDQLTPAAWCAAVSRMLRLCAGLPRPWEWHSPLRVLCRHVAITAPEPWWQPPHGALAVEGYADLLSLLARALEREHLALRHIIPPFVMGCERHLAQLSEHGPPGLRVAQYRLPTLLLLLYARHLTAEADGLSPDPTSNETPHGTLILGTKDFLAAATHRSVAAVL